MMSVFDWNKHWRDTCEPEGARRFSLKMADMICDFIQDKTVKSIADYGCGHGTLLFTLAKRFRETEFYGFDASNSLVRVNAEKALQRDLKNLHFEHDCLPNPRAERTFDLLMCFATLHYVKEIQCALRNLFQLVNPKGYLIFNYPNVYTRAAYRRDIEPDNEYMKRRFALVLAGTNLLSLKKIERILGIRPKKFYSSTKANIYVRAQTQ